MSFWKRFRHFVHRETRQVEHLGKRTLYYTAKESAVLTGVAAAAVSYAWTPLAGAAVGAIGGEATYYGEYYAARENPRQGHKYSPWEARKKARSLRRRAWEYGAIGASVGGLASVVAPASSVFAASQATLDAANYGAEAGFVNSQALEEGSSLASHSIFEAGAPSFSASIEFGASGSGPTIPGENAPPFLSGGPESGFPVSGYGSLSSLQPTVLPGQSASGVYSGGGFFGNAWNTITNLPTLAYDNPTATFGIAGTGAGVAAQLGLFGKSGQAVAQDIQLGEGLAGALGSGGLSGGGPPISGEAGGAGDFAPLPSLLSEAAPYLIGFGVFLLLLVLFAG